MRNKFFFLFTAILMIATSCKMSTADLKAEEAALRKTDSTWAALAKEGAETEKIVSYWADDAVVLAPGEAPIRGKDALRKMVEDSKKIPGFSITWRSTDVQLSPDGKMAYMSGQNLMTMNDSSGNKLSMLGRAYTIWRKQSNGEWKCVVDTWNNL